MTAGTLRVLIVDDSDDDAALLLRALRQGPWTITYERVDTPDAMTAALDTQPWDLIIADYSMPRFSGPAALTLSIGRSSDLPFILVSGIVGEEIAVAAMKAGADDYFSKGNLSRLVPAVERELHRAAARRETRRIEQQLQHREKQLAAALKLARVGTWHLDISADAAVWSDEACQIIGFAGNQAATSFEAFLIRLHPNDRVLLCDLLHHPDTKQFAHDFQMARADGEIQIVQVRGDIIRDGNLNPVQAAGMIQDITEQKCAEAELSEQRARFETILSSIGDAVIVTDPQSRVTFMNPTAETLTGWSQKEALQKPLADVFNIVHEHSTKSVESPVTKAIRDGAIVGLANHTVLISRNGARWPIDDSAAPILDDRNRIVGVVLVFHDISSRRASEHELKLSEVRYRRLFEAAHDGILIADAETYKVLDVNRFMINLLGYSRKHLLGKELWEIGVFENAESSKVAMETLQRLGTIRYDDLSLKHLDGRRLPVEFVSNVYNEGKRSVIQCNIRDVSDRKRVDEELARARDAAETANRSKSEFLANMSHEIRTPMSAILGFAEMLLNRSPEECEQLHCVQTIRRNALHLLELINEILDLSKIEAGQMKVDHLPCDLPTLLADIIALMRPRAAEKGLKFNVEFSGSIPRVIQSDPLRLRQILVNLLGNAIKFTEAGTIDLRIASHSGDDGEIGLSVDVSDSGIGMTDEQLGRLFQPFTQGDQSITRKFGGTGLGLTISRRIARLLDGDISVTSAFGKGSTFTLNINGGPSAGVEHLPGMTEAQLPEHDAPGARADIEVRARVLLVDDGTDNQRLLRMMLSSAGATVTSAENGQIAVDLATRQPFDLILMDMQMPVMDGYAATAELRRRGFTIPIVALTAYAMAEDRSKCMACGCSGYLTKPIGEELLLKTVNQQLEIALKSAHPAPAAPAASKTSTPLSAATTEHPDRITSSFAGNARMMKIIPEFVDGLPAQVSKMSDLLARNDLAALRPIVHQLLGACGGYGFDSVTEPARSAETAINTGKALEVVTAEVNALIEMIRRISGYKDVPSPQRQETAA